MRLEGKAAPITGANHGIGKATALLLACGGTEGAAAVQGQIAAMGRRCHVMQAEIAVVAFLVSDDAAYVTGQTLFVDGGLLIPPVTTADYLRGERTQPGSAG